MNSIDIYRFAFSPWFWLALCVIFTVIELASSFNLITVWFAFSALVVVLVSGLTETLAAPLRFRLHTGIFLVLAAALLVFTRPIIIKKFRAGRAKTNVEDLAGREALVIKKIGKYERGEIKTGGQIWTAISEEGAEIEEGTECIIVRIEGVKAVVKKRPS